MNYKTDDNNFIWINEPSKIDDTFAARDESTIDWLRRSTDLRAKDSRNFINYNLGKIPNQYRSVFIDNLNNNWESAIFELILARYLQELGAKLYYEKPITGGKRPDFTVEFPDGSIITEAISPVFDSELMSKEKDNLPLIEYIERTKPQDWLILSRRLPIIGPSDSKKEFKKKFDDICNMLNSTKENEISISEIISSGHIDLACTRTDKEYKRIGGPIYTSWDDTQSRIIHAINKKRSQVRESTFPVILAINASGLSSNSENFEHALYGHSVDVVGFRSSDHLYSYFKEDGLFTKKKNIKPTYAGVFACFHYGLSGGKPPILYINPNYSGKLPDEILKLEQRNYDFKTKSINIKNSQYYGLISKLFFPTH